MEKPIKVPDSYLFILNQLFEIENKLRKLNVENSIQRNIERLKEYYQTQILSDGMGLSYYDPVGEKYNETRTDCTASISGEGFKDLKIVEVLKPIIFLHYANTKIVVQKAIVIVESETKK